MNAVSMLMNSKRPASEIQQSFVEAKNAHLVIKHEEYAMFLNDESYEEAESWMMDCTENYPRFAIEVSECLRCQEKAKKQESCQTSISGNAGAKPTGDEEFVQKEDGDDNGKEDEDDSIKLTQVKTSKSLILKHEKPKLPFFLW